MVLTTLWMPVLLSAVIVFIASSILHVVSPHHRSDYKKLPDEEAARAAMRGVPPGLYMIPYCSHDKAQREAAKDKFKDGPVAAVTMRPSGEINMGTYLVQWFLYCVLVSYFVAYVALHTLPTGTRYPQVFRIVGAAAFLAYGVSQVANGIWKGQPWGVTIKEVIDGLIYALLTAGTFGWLWPR